MAANGQPGGSAPQPGGGGVAQRRIGPGVVMIEPSPGRHGGGCDKRARVVSSSGSGQCSPSKLGMTA